MLAITVLKIVLKFTHVNYVLACHYCFILNISLVERNAFFIAASTNW